MKLNNKGFAITSIIYSILVLFLALSLLILNNMSVRQNIFEKQKQDILDKFENISGDRIICRAATEPFSGNIPTGNFTLGDAYICNPGDEDRIFYVLRTTEDTVSLIMNENLVNSVAWCGNELQCKTNGEWNNTNGPLTAQSALNTATRIWINLNSQQISLPDLPSFSNGILPDWISVNTESTAYWTSNIDESLWTGGNINNDLYYACSGGIIDTCHIGATEFTTAGSIHYTMGIRPVITINKSQISG